MTSLAYGMTLRLISAPAKKKNYTPNHWIIIFYISSIQSLGYYESKYTPVGAELFLEAGQEKRLC